MKKLAVSLLIALLSLNSFAQEADVDAEPSAAAESFDYQAPASAGHSLSGRIQAEQERRARVVARQRAFNLRGIELFEQAINDSARYTMTIIVNGEQTHTESKNIRPNGSSGSIARGFAEQMRVALDGPTQTEDGGRLKFKCQQDNALAQLPIFRLFLKPGRCTLTLNSLSSEQRQRVTLSFVMELTDTEEHENWPSRIISPEIKLEIEATDRNRIPHGPRNYRN
jgi:hypothetical protein